MQSSIRPGRPEARIVLQPLAAPSVLGYFALASALIVYGSWFAGGWGTEKDPESFFPFLLLFGGVGQLGAALWSYRARSAVGAALHGSWAAFWMGVGLIYLLVALVVAAAVSAQLIQEGKWPPNDANRTMASYHYNINTLDNFPQAYINGQPVFRAMYEDNDPGKRIIMMVNYNTDISQYWEWSGRGFRPFDETNEAYKLGVNYLIYGLTH